MGGALTLDRCFRSTETIRVFGATIALRASDATALRQLVEAAPPLHRRSRTLRPDRTYQLRAAGPCPCGELHGTAALSGLSDEATEVRGDLDDLMTRYTRDAKMFVAGFSPRRVFVHAGVVAWNGRAAVIPGMSFSGKTTLVRALLDAGATYYSDEYAVLDERGRVHPYPQPLGIRTPDHTRQIATDPASLGYPIGTNPIPVSMVILTEHRAGHSGPDWSATPLSPARSILESSHHTVGYGRRPERSLHFLCAALGRAKAFQGPRGDAIPAARLILSYLQEPTAADG